MAQSEQRGPSLARSHSAATPLRSLGVAHAAHDRSLGLQVPHHPIRQLQLSALDIVCGWITATGQHLSSRPVTFCGGHHTTNRWAVMASVALQHQMRTCPRYRRSPWLTSTLTATRVWCHSARYTDP